MSFSHHIPKIDIMCPQLTYLEQFEKYYFFSIELENEYYEKSNYDWCGKVLTAFICPVGFHSFEKSLTWLLGSL